MAIRTTIHFIRNNKALCGLKVNRLSKNIELVTCKVCIARHQPEPIQETDNRFWSKVNIGTPDKCWEWQASTFDFGYGLFYKSRRNGKGGACLAHRMAYELTYGPISKNMCVLHKCDNPPCCNPSHLFLGTRKENNADRDKKGRFVTFTRDNHPIAKLTSKQVEEIKNLYPVIKNQTKLAKMFNVSQSAISLILKKT